MEKIKISASQLFVLVFLFEMGSSILFGLGANAKQDAWITILLGLAGGLIVFFIHYRLFLFYPELILTSYIKKIAGKWPGQIIALFYITYFIYLTARVLRDFGELLVTTVYTNTPLFVINTLMVLTIIYGIHKGLEVIARVGQIYFGIVYFMALIGFLLIIFSGLIHFEFLKPILENGWKPVFKTFFHETLVFPFGEIIVFTMIYPLVNASKKIKFACMGGMILSGLNITITVIITMSTIGPELYTRTTFPLLTTVSRIELANFIERLDVLFMLYLIIGGFFKILLYFYVAVAGTADLFQYKKLGNLVFPIGMIVLFASISIASTYAEFNKEGLKFEPVYLDFPFQIIIPSILLLIAFLRNRKKKSNSNIN
ncbi:spore gernimation protein KB [Bacillus salipaludis]|uniref:GerAB/ArcD/ProY family transporter n=1 Tax=Bacillus salipaludis TaxID=2547811 RepID=A0A4R5VKE9_9BACI|nr:GerAB/ArcD/ProY family transporter [Bacillus salipaludis]MDQ6598910.1 GerAB/ArcD/ProY family transporter [Bacillus salipaludis]TDK58189.1 spore gernimation protein KB [Bacillus salipaludis]